MLLKNLTVKGFPCFLKAFFTTLLLRKTCISFCSQEKTRGGFLLLQKKGEPCSAFVLLRTLAEAAPSSLPGTTQASQHQVARTLDGVYEHLCLLSLFVHPLARCVRRSWLLCFMPFRLRFHRMLSAFRWWRKPVNEF